MVDVKELEGWLWEAACKIRGEIDAAKYKDYILPLIFLKRLSDVYDDELDKLAKEYGDKATADELVAADHTLVWFYLPENARWANIMRQSTRLGEYLTDAVRAVARENPKLQGVIDIKDFNETASGQRIVSDERLKALIDTLNRHRLGQRDVEPDLLGRAYEYLLRKFSEGSGQSAGEFYTPKEVAILMARIMEPQPGDELDDPCLGSGGLLIKAYLRFKERYGEDTTVKPLAFYGQEALHNTYAMAKMNSFIHQMDANFALGDTMNRPAFTEADGSLKKFNIIVANPMWNQEFPQSTYETDQYRRFGYGFPPNSTADWGWIQHMFASLKDNGRMAVVLDTGSVSRGSGNQGSNRERDIRKEFIAHDVVEAVILLPENLFYNTSAPGIILILNKRKRHVGQVLLINASKLFEKGRPKNFIPERNVDVISDIYLHWREEDGVSKILTNEEIATKHDYNISPSRYASKNGEDDAPPLEEAVVLVRETDEECRRVEEKMRLILQQMGLNL